MDRILNMILRQITRRLINKGINAGIKKAASIGKTQPREASQDLQAEQMTRQARQSAKLVKRSTRL
ncbi:hypothetical protein [uncultured Roseobacter sp.]|uniref:hypothetical protein n=1 Tax=uncultured Roseobacter sp. TaxID=114847 RepID=UPI00260B8D50|nr:hypothetical protein [uncultured Roseobacter sp.]